MSRFTPRVIRRTEDTGNPFWISYSDLMTALVMLFLVVMSISMVAIATRPLAEKKQRETDIQSILNQLETRADEVGLDLDINRATRTINFGERAQFAFNSYYLSPTARKKLRSFVPLLLEAYNEKQGRQWLKRIHIEGYTDATGTYLYNVNLSLNRAQAVVCALFAADLPMEKHNLLRQLLIIDGASITGIKESADASRRVAVRLSFRQADDQSIDRPPIDMPMGRCAIEYDHATRADRARERVWKRQEAARQRAAAVAAAKKQAIEPTPPTTNERSGDLAYPWASTMDPPMEHLQEMLDDGLIEQ